MPKKQEPKAGAVRDAFTMPERDYRLISEIKARALAKGLERNKSEILRAGILALASMGDAALLKALKNVERVRAGRPKGKQG